MIYDVNGNVILSNGGEQWRGKKWFAYGTSLTNIANEGKYATYLAQISGMTLTNKGISGGSILGNIKSAVMNTTDGKLAADLITLEVGANDFSDNIGTIYDTGNTTFCGALNQCIRYLQANTNAQIVVLSSTCGRYPPNNPSSPYTHDQLFNNHTIYDVYTAIRQVCGVNGVYYIPFGDGLGLGLARMQASNDYNVDQVHHTNLGGYNLAQGVWGYLKNIPLWYTSIPT